MIYLVRQGVFPATSYPEASSPPNDGIPRLDLFQPGIPPQSFVYPTDRGLLPRHRLIPGNGRLNKGSDGLFAVSAS